MKDEHLALAEMAQRFFQTEMAPRVDAWRSAGRVDPEFWRLAGEVGLLGASVPQE